MNNSLKKVLLVIVAFFLFIISSSATTTSRAYINSSCNIRKGPSTKYGYISQSNNMGAYYNLVTDQTFSDENNHVGCNSDWYQIYYDGINTGYVCGDHVDVVTSYSTDDVAPSTSCEIEMNNLGFPSSYWGGLCRLKERHPNWQFQAIITNIDWAYAVERESACGKSYLQTNNEEYMDRSCNNAYGWSSSWKNASQKAVAYYMDPRNFLSDRYIFQFEYLKYSNALSTFYPSSISTILSNANFYQYHNSLGNDFSTILNNVGIATDVSPISLASRILQELGTSTELYNLYSGVYPGYEGFYNFYNFGVSDECATTSGTTVCGLSYAQRNNWYGLEEALKGGASQISKNYISAGQYSVYLQKFNVVPTDPSSTYVHQYMTNIAAPTSESVTAYNSYTSSKVLDNAFIFYIPVYTNMATTISNSSGGGTGELPESNLSSMPISTIVTSSGYSYQSGYISQIALGSDVATLKGALESVAGINNVVIMDASGAIIQSGTLATGYKVQITNMAGFEILEVVIKGDTSGDGIINALDLLQVQKYILGTYNLTGASLLAGDTSKDGTVNALDLLQIQKHILGTFTVVQ